jgi:hypothetical protein
MVVSLCPLCASGRCRKYWCSKWATQCSFPTCVLGSNTLLPNRCVVMPKREMLGITPHRYNGYMLNGVYKRYNAPVALNK